MSLSVLYSVDRTSLSLASLDLTTANGYRVVSAGPGGTTWVKTYARSPFTKPILTNAIEDTETLTIVVRCIGSSWSDVRSKIATLRTALGQFSYTVTETIESVTTTFACDPGDTILGASGTWQVADLRAKAQIVTCHIPRAVTPTAGSL